jgi:hypothetical protein
MFGSDRHNEPYSGFHLSGETPDRRQNEIPQHTLESQYDMDIREFLHWVRKPYSVFDRENCFSELVSLFKLYDDMLYHFDLEVDNPLELILTQSRPQHTTQIVTLDLPFIVLELQDLNRISQALEFFTFHDIDQNAPISLFHALWIEFHEKYEFIAQVNVGDAGNVHVPVLITSEEAVPLRTDLVQKFAASPLTESICHLRGFQKIFEIVPAFAIAHEIAHFRYSGGSSIEEKDILTSIATLPAHLQSGPYFDPRIRLMHERPVALNLVEG